MTDTPQPLSSEKLRPTAMRLAANDSSSSSASVTQPVVASKTRSPSPNDVAAFDLCEDEAKPAAVSKQNLDCTQLSLQKVYPSKKKRSIIWNQRYERFREFYEENGHLTIPRSDADHIKLSQWLTYQRHHAKLTENQRTLLEAIHYKDSTCTASRLANDAKWKEKFEKLEILLEETGSLRVPAKERGLAKWVSKQREFMRNNTIDPARKEKLRKLGVVPKPEPNIRKDSTRAVDDAKWQSHYVKLQKFLEIHGHCNVPRKFKEDLALGRWVSEQRVQYRLMLASGEHFTGNGMNAYRKEQLEKIGFQWNLRRVRPNTAKAASATTERLHSDNSLASGINSRTQPSIMSRQNHHPELKTQTIVELEADKPEYQTAFTDTQNQLSTVLLTLQEQQEETSHLNLERDDGQRQQLALSLAIAAANLPQPETPQQLEQPQPSPRRRPEKRKQPTNDTATPSTQDRMSGKKAKQLDSADAAKASTTADKELDSSLVDTDQCLFSPPSDKHGAGEGK